MIIPAASSLEIRHEALKTIRQCLSGMKVQEAFNKNMEASRLGIQQRSVCADLAYGYLRNRIKLDFIIGDFLKKPEKLPKDMLILLGLATYSLLFQEKSPPYATINETVGWIKKFFGQTLAKVANAVLRNIQRKEKELKDISWYFARLASELKAWSVFYSVPFSVCDLWHNAYGMENAKNLMARSAKRPWQGIRLNPGHEDYRVLKDYIKNLTDAEEIENYGYAFAPGALPEILNGRPLTAWVNDGAASMQSPASMRIMKELELVSLEGEVWDCCAGSGIKAQALLERNVNVQLASDTSLHRLKNIEPFCARLKLETPITVQASAVEPAIRKWGGHIIADVPCSGLGVMGRRPDIRENMADLGKINNHVLLQKEILRAASRCLQKGKRLIYMTCTLNPQENENVIADFVQNNPQFLIIREWQTPHTHPWLDGMYGAVLEKK